MVCVPRRFSCLLVVGLESRLALILLVEDVHLNRPVVVAGHLLDQVNDFVHVGQAVVGADEGPINLCELLMPCTRYSCPRRRGRLSVNAWVEAGDCLHV